MRDDGSYVSKLKGIDTIYIINLLGSFVREYNMREQMAKLGFIENVDYEFIRPINFAIDGVTIEELTHLGIFPVDVNLFDNKLYSNGLWKLGTVSLSMITYYIFLKAKRDNKTILIFEDNITLCDDFINKYNTFYDNLPDNNWKSLELHSFNNCSYTKECYDHYCRIQDTYSGLKNIVIKDYVNNRIINNESRAIYNDKVLIGVNEGSGTKAYVIKPCSLNYIQPLPIVNPSDGIKNWLSGHWNEGLSYVPSELLINEVDGATSDRRDVDSKISKGTYQKLPDRVRLEIIETLQSAIYTP